MSQRDISAVESWDWRPAARHILSWIESTLSDTPTDVWMDDSKGSPVINFRMDYKSRYSDRWNQGKFKTLRGQLGRKFGLTPSPFDESLYTLPNGQKVWVRIFVGGIPSGERLASDKYDRLINIIRRKDERALVRFFAGKNLANAWGLATDVIDGDITTGEKAWAYDTLLDAAGRGPGSDVVPKYASAEDVAARFAASMSLPKFKKMVAEAVGHAKSKHELAQEPKFVFAAPGEAPHVMADPSKALSASYSVLGRTFSLYWTPETGFFSDAGSHIRGSVPWMGELTPQQAGGQLVNFLQFVNNRNPSHSWLVRPKGTASPTPTAPSGGGQTWSAVTTGEGHGYATEISTFDSKGKAEDYARGVGGAYVLKGTQMWNEPVGQIEEGDQDAPYRWVGGRLASSEDVLRDLAELEQFKRSVGHSDEERDLLSVRLGVRVRSWRGRVERGTLTDKDRADIKEALASVRGFGPDRTAGKATQPNAQEKAQISAYYFGHITREQLEARITKSKADLFAPIKKVRDNPKAAGWGQIQGDCGVCGKRLRLVEDPDGGYDKVIEDHYGFAGRCRGSWQPPQGRLAASEKSVALRFLKG